MHRHLIALCGALLTLGMSLAACDSSPETPAARPSATPIRGPAPTAVPSLRLVTPGTGTPASLRVLVHADDVDPALYEMFSRETGITIVEETYAADEEVTAYLRERPAQFDLIIVYDRILRGLIADGRLAPLDTASMASFSGVEARLKDQPFDRGNRYSMPFAWGTVGILYRTDQPVTVDSWSVVFDPARNKPLADKVALLDDPQMGLSTALKARGDALNPADEAAWTRARDQLAANRATIVMFDSTAWSNDLVSGDLFAAQAYSDDAAFAQWTNANLRYAVPREGAPLWMQNLAIPAASAHKADAQRLADFLLRPASAARTVTYTYSLSPVPEAYNRVDAALAAQLRDSYIPSDEVFRRSEFATDLGPARQRIEQLWADLKK